MSTCSGACCAVFHLPYTIRDFKRRVTRGMTKDGECTLEDGVYIADMLIPLTVEQARDRATKFGSSLRILKHSEGHHFTCRHWDEDSRRCGAYNDRPAMCSEFPYGDPCSLGTGCHFQVSAKVLAQRKIKLADFKARNARALALRTATL